MKDSQKSPHEASKELMLAEFERIRELFIKNEEDGNIRINLFITLTTSLMGAFGISKHFEDKHNFEVGLLFVPVLIGLFFLGIFILRRIIKRNRDTDEYKDKLDKIRCYFLEYDPPLEKFLPYLPSAESKNRTEERIEEWKNWYSTGTGGYAQIMVLLNSFIFGFTLISLFVSADLIVIDSNNNVYEIYTWNLLVGLSIFIWTLDIYVYQHLIVMQWYKKKKNNN